MQHTMTRVRLGLQRWWPLIAVMVLAAALRLYALDLIDLRFDEASAPQFALGIAQGQWLAVAPFSGSVANHPPIYLYVLALPYLFTRDLLAVAAYRVLLDVAAIGLFGWLCARYFNRRVALVAMLLFAVTPWAVQFARKLWLAPLPLFSVVLLFGLLEVLRRRNPWGWAIAGLGLALCIGTHLSAIYLAPVVLLALLLALPLRAVRPLPLLVGAAPLLLLAFGYLQHDATQDFANTRALIGALRSEGDAPAQVTPDALQFALWSSGGAHLSDLTDGAYPQWQAQVPAWLDLIDSLQLVVLIAGLLALATQIVVALSRRQWRDAAVPVFLLAWWCLPVLLQLRHSRPLQVHYLTPLYPVPFLVMGLFVDRVRKWGAGSEAWGAGRGVTVAVVAALALITGWQMVTTIRFAHFVERYDTSNGGYGLPVRSVLAVAQMARAEMCDETALPDCAAPSDVIAVAPGGDPLVNEQATILRVVLADMPHRFANSDAGLILRPDPAQYIFAPGAERALQALLQNVEPGNVLTHAVPIRLSGGGAYTYVRVAEPMAHNYTPVEPARWANGVTLLGYRAQLDEALHLEVLLRVDQAPAAAPAAPADYHWFNHVLVGDQKVAQLDGGGINPSNWRAGDVLLHWFDIALPQPAPQPPYVVRVGSYEYPAIQNVPVTLADGQISDGVSLPLGVP